MRLHAFKWNKRDKEHTVVILTTEDIEQGNFEHAYGAGFELLILPIAYKDSGIAEIETAIMMAEVRNGEVVYV